jgi:hypothetical protein
LEVFVDLLYQEQSLWWKVFKYALQNLGGTEDVAACLIVG